ncbi:MAG: hypothetical protein KC502_07390 [Myxococcales bacterium]|nr:hypothetical protein [Myxococcales bacterium]
MIQFVHPMLVRPPLTDVAARPWAVTCVLVAVMWTSSAYGSQPTGPDQDARVLPAGVEKTIEAAFLRAAPAWRLDSARVAKVSVSAKVCASEGSCHDVVLSDPDKGCKGDKAGPWCVVWKAAAPADKATLYAALRGDKPATIWHTIAARPKQPDVVHTAESPQPQPGAEDQPREEDSSTMLLIAALIAAAAATFALFRVTDEPEAEAPPEPNADDDPASSSAESDEEPSESSLLDGDAS